MDNSCSTKYPIMLIHGIGYRDNKHPRYWGRIPSVLEERGACIYYGNQDGQNSIQNNAAQIKASIEAALKDSGKAKINLIAHSKGGLEARYLISRLDMADKVASLTTIATPHRGSKTMDSVLRSSNVIVKAIAGISDRIFRRLGDRQPDSTAAFNQISADYADVFNEMVPDAKGVYYQSYAFAMKKPSSDVLMAVPYRIIKTREGENDGLVSVESAKWGDFKGVYSGAADRGISHPEAVDSQRRPMVKNGDITELYIKIVRELKDMGF